MPYAVINLFYLVGSLRLAEAITLEDDKKTEKH